ncbi:tyrosine-type recombinase/integrase [Rhodoferax sp.]|uniref:tyrosine-type recombinase/integrase n=1 Tax=Rhodoferax sp. TaxID=50421 RepID=UPI002778142A|nr:integrase family protein [Rhodoferax sp.]
MALTDLSLRTLKPVAGKQVTYTDRSLKGFGVRVGKSGAMTYVLVVGANRKRIKLGDVGVLKLAEARAAARVKLAEKQLGIHQHTTAPTYNDALETFLKVKEQEHGCKPRTLRDYKRLLTRHGFGLDKLDRITPNDVQGKLDKLAKTPSEQAHAYSAYQIFFKFAFRRHYLDRHPMERMEPKKPRPSRKRILSFDELKRVWNACDGAFGDIIKLCILLGQRRSEIAQVEQAWVEGDELSFPASVAKNRVGWRVPLEPMALEIIRSRFTNSPYLFPARKTWRQKSSVYNAWGKDKPKLDEKAQVFGWVIHDLRRSFQTHLTSLGVPENVSDRLMNHITGAKQGTLGVYQHYDYASEKREAMMKWKTHLSSLLATDQ